MSPWLRQCCCVHLVGISLVVCYAAVCRESERSINLERALISVPLMSQMHLYVSRSLTMTYD